MEEFLWINDVRNNMSIFNSVDFEEKKMFWVIDNRTCKVYNIRLVLNEENKKKEVLLPVELQNKRFIDWAINSSLDFKKYVPKEFLDSKIIINDYLIKSYINGKKVLGYDIDDLEDNYQFMIRVMEYTKDKNMFELCSENVKNTYEVVDFILDNFSNDIEFTIEVISNYLDNERNKAKYLEILIRVCNLYGYDNICCLEYSRQLDEEYKAFIGNISYMKTSSTSDNSYLIENGFYFVLDNYKDNKIVVNYFASRFINDYFNDINLERKIYKSFKTYEELEVLGINKYLIKLLNEYDTKLAGYVISNIYLLNCVKYKLNKIRDNWDANRSFYKRVLTFYSNR